MDCVVLRFMHVIAAVGFSGILDAIHSDMMMVWRKNSIYKAFYRIPGANGMFGERSESQSHRFAAIWWIDMQFRCAFLDFFRSCCKENMAFVDVLNKLRVKEFLAESAALSRDALAESSRRHVVERACACQVTTRYLCLGVVWKGTEWALSWPTLCFVFWGFVATLDPSLQYLIQGSLAQAQVSIWCDTFTFWGFTCWNASWCSSLHQAKNYWSGTWVSAVSHVFTFYRNAFAWNFDGMRSISGEFIPHRFKFVYVAITNQPWTLFFYLLYLWNPASTTAFPRLLSSVPGYIPKDSHLSASGPRYYLETLLLHSAFWNPFSSLFCCNQVIKWP